MSTEPRFEFKYIADANTVNALKERLRDLMYPDPNTIDGGYHVNSIYYDTPQLDCYYEKLDGEKRRFKIRARWYGELDESTDLASKKVYVEIKHRNNDMNYKNRASIPANHLPELARNAEHLSQLGQLVDEKQVLEATIIERITGQMSLFPSCLVSYYRQPLLCRINPRLRVTFDSQLRTLGATSYNQTNPENGTVVLPPELCVVEIKFNWAMPLWLLEVCREVGLNLRRYSKYASSLEKTLPEFTDRQIRHQEALR
jgi:hypothetical protein